MATKPTVIRTAYDGSQVRVQTICPEPTLADDSQREASDVNNIVARYLRAGLPIPPADKVVFADVSNMGTYQDAQNQIALAKTIMDKLPPDTRNFFKNDPATFLDFMADTANEDKAIELGLVQPKEAAPPAPIPPAPPAPPTGSGTTPAE